MRVVVVGTGPAGVRAAQALVEAGLRPVVVEEGGRDGGQVYRRQPDHFKRDYAALYGPDAAKAQALHRSFDALRPHIDHRPDTLAWNVADGVLHTVHAGQPQATPFDALLLCPGATDRLMPLDGWHRAGCYSLGAAQIALKSQACAIGSRVVFAGTGPLLYLVASQYIKAGAQVAAVLDTSPARPSLAAIGKLLSRPQLLLRGLGLIAGLRRAGVEVLAGVALLRVEGSAERGVEGLSLRDAAGRERRFACDAVGLGYHLRSETQLADLAGCGFAFDDASRQWLPQLDADGRSSVPGVYLAGDGARLQG
ncbi:MAG TPA: FAD/NAD(P)-binding oxidoreductase, partial [Ideonella sp.]|nr:FAD/NAD(P)-binding oxidoreductase [Ideonella sp.]